MPAYPLGTRPRATPSSSSSRPRVSGGLPLASVTAIPRAVRTWEGASSIEAQAEPVLAQIPATSSRRRRASPSRPPKQKEALPGSRSVELTPIEFRLLHCLMRNSGRVLTHEQLLSTVWGYDYEGYSNQVAVYVRRLRSKLEPDPDHPRYILTARGLGYRFEAAG